MFVSFSLGTCPSNTQADASAYVRFGRSMNTRLIYALLMVCLSWTAVAWSAEEGEAIERTVKEAAMAAATFSETRDKQAVLKLYTKDYVGIQDGETETRDSIEKWLSDYESELNKGSTLRFISAVSNLHVRMPGPTAWATYDYVFQAIRKGELEAQDSGQCTTLLRKEGSAWLIQHEHCSKTGASNHPLSRSEVCPASGRILPASPRGWPA